MNPSSSLSDLVGGARGRLLEVVAQVGRPMSIRRFADLANVDQKGAGAILRDFAELGLVRSERVGKAISYEPMADNVLLGLVRRIRTLQREIVDALAERAEKAPDGVTLAVFGSVAAGRATKGSDLDLLVIVDPDVEAAADWADDFIRFAQRASGLDVNPLRFTPEEWSAAKKERALIVATIQDRHRLLCGEL